MSKRDARQSGWSPEHDLVATVARGQLVLARDLDVAIAAELRRYEGTFASHAYDWLARFGVRRLARRFVS